MNCSAVVETLFESELFGHVKGSFTGATGDKLGLVEHASGGTLFLDEIGDMPLGTQAQAAAYHPASGGAARRLAAGSQGEYPRHRRHAPRPARHDSEKGKFREDLYYRLSMVEIGVPALAEQKEDLPLLTRHFIAKFSRQFDKRVRGVTPRASIALSRYDWPGNVRELENAIGHASMMLLSDMIDIGELPEYIRSPDPPQLPPDTPASVPDDNSPASRLADAERRLNSRRPG